jgi:hypothetical protein
MQKADENEDDDDKDVLVKKCLTCKKVIEGKPWISIEIECTYHGCSYLCSKSLHENFGNGYWTHVINKEDFDEPRPICQKPTKLMGDITTGFGQDEIRDEIEQENQRTEMLEYEYECEFSSSEEDTFDEDNYY